MGGVEGELQAGPLPRDRLLPLGRDDDVGRFTLGAGFPFFFVVDFDGSSTLADVPRPIQEQLDAKRRSETDHELAIQIGNHAGGDHSLPQVKMSDIR